MADFNSEIELDSVYSFPDELDILVYQPGSASPETLTLQYPNGGQGFSFSIKEIQKSIFRNGKGQNKKGYCEYEIRLFFDYASHWIELNKLLTAEKITIKFPTPFAYPMQYDFILENDEIVKKWLASRPVTYKTKSRFFGVPDISAADKKYYNVRDANPFPDAEVTLAFVSIKNFTPAEIESILWFEPVVEVPGIAFWTGDPFQDLTIKDLAINDGTLEIITGVLSGVNNEYLNLESGLYFYIKQTEGSFVSNIFNYLASVQIAASYDYIGLSADGYPVYLVVVISVGTEYQVRLQQVPELSNTLNIKVLFVYRIYLQTLNAEGTGDIEYYRILPISGKAAANDILGIWDIADYIYIKLNELKTPPIYIEVLRSNSADSGYATSTGSHEFITISGVTYLKYQVNPSSDIGEYVWVKLDDGEFTGSYTTSVKFKINYPFMVFLYNLEISGEYQSAILPESETLDSRSDIIGSSFEYKTHVYMKATKQPMVSSVVYYSIDNGTSWILYDGVEEVENIVDPTDSNIYYAKVKMPAYLTDVRLRMLDSESSKTTNHVTVYAEAPFLSYIKTEVLDREPDSAIVPISSVPDTSGNVIEAVYTKKSFSYIYAEIDNLNNSEVQGSFDNISWFDISTSSIISSGGLDYIKIPILKYGSSYNIRILDLSSYLYGKNLIIESEEPNDGTFTTLLEEFSNNKIKTEPDWSAVAFTDYNEEFLIKIKNA